MTFKINGFGADMQEKKGTVAAQQPEVREPTVPRKSLVQVQFPGRGMALSYFNDLFDLKVGDLVYVDGKLEGQLGRVTDISYNFKIKLSDYKKVVAVVDTEVHGQFYIAGSHFVTFDPGAIPPEKVSLWFKAPAKEGEEIVSSTDDTSFHLENLKGINVTAAIAERGHDYYMENRVRYLCLNGTQGLAIVEGNENYTVEFEYQDGEISHLICECPCGYTCKHAFATMLQLRETLELIEKHYAEEYQPTGYFAAIQKGTFFTYAIGGKETGRFEL